MIDGDGRYLHVSLVKLAAATQRQRAATGAAREVRLEIALRSTVRASAMDTKLNTSRTADHGAGFHHRLARYTCHASGIALWICLACWAGIRAAVNRGDAKKKAKRARRIHGAIPGSLRHVEFWSLRTTVAAAANGTKPTTQELAEVTLDPPNLRV